MRTDIEDFLGLERNLLLTFGAILALGMGEELWSRFVPKYLQALGAGAMAVAAYGTMSDLLSALYQYPGGWLADRMGRRNALMAFTCLAAFGYVLYLVAPSWKWVLVGVPFVLAWSSLAQPAIFAAIGDNLPRDRRAIGFGVQSILKRIPIVLAPPLGGLLMAKFGMVRGIRVGLVTTLALVPLAFLLLHKYQAESVPNDRAGIGKIWREIDPGLKRLLVADCLARWAGGMPKVFVVLYVVDHLKAGAFKFGLLTSLQMTASILPYIPVAKLADRWGRRPFVALTFTFFSLFPLSLALAKSTSWLILAFLTAGLREIGEPARKALIVDLCPAERRGRSVGVYYLIRGLVVFPASLLGGWLWGIGPEVPFYVASCIGLIGLVAFLVGGPKG